MELRGVEIHIGAMDYGFPIQGILGLDFLLQVRAVIATGARILCVAAHSPGASARRSCLSPKRRMAQERWGTAPQRRGITRRSCCTFAP
jgi:hypothetical protein